MACLKKFWFSLNMKLHCLKWAEYFPVLLKSLLNQSVVDLGNSWIFSAPDCGDGGLYILPYSQ